MGCGDGFSPNTERAQSNEERMPKADLGRTGRVVPRGPEILPRGILRSTKCAPCGETTGKLPANLENQQGLKSGKLAAILIRLARFPAIRSADWTADPSAELTRQQTGQLKVHLTEQLTGRLTSRLTRQLAIENGSA